MCMARHAHITQNNKFAISLQHLKKEVSDAADFLHADKHQSFLQVEHFGRKRFRQGDTIATDGHDLTFAK